MADVFLSYSNRDVERVQPLIGFIESNGFTVWWDRSIIAGESWSAAIEAELNKATSVIVVWSENSVKSEWVQIEAGKSKEKKTYVPIIIDDVIKKLPLEFSRLEVANFMGFDEGNELVEKDVLLTALNRNKNKDWSETVETSTTTPYVNEYNKRKFWQKWQTKITVIAAAIGIALTLFNTISSFKKETGAIAVVSDDETHIEFMYLTLSNFDLAMPDTMITDSRIKLFLNYPRVNNEIISLTQDSSFKLSTDSFPLKTTYLLIENKGTTLVSDIQLEIKKVFIKDSVLIQEKTSNVAADYEQQLSRKAYKSEKETLKLPLSLDPSSGVLVPLFEIIKPKPGSPNWAFSSRNVSLPENLVFKNKSGKKITIKIRKMVTPITFKGGLEARG